MDKKLTIAFKIGVLVSILFLAFWLWQNVLENKLAQDLVSEYGYWAAFTLGVIGGLNLVVPVPAVAFLPVFLEAGMGLWPVVFIITAGMLLADSFAFLLGKTGRQFLISSKQKAVLKKLKLAEIKNSKLPYLILFLFASFAPFPNEVLVIPMAFLGYRLKYLILPLVSGTLVFNVLYAAGITNIFKFVENLL